MDRTGRENSSIRDLGRLSGPVIVFGGTVSNLQATEAILAVARDMGIPYDRMICTGDVVAYCADPVATVDAIRTAAIPTVMGNCEESLGAGADDCGCGFAEGSTCDALSDAWYRHAASRLDPDARRWMRDLPRAIRFSFAGRRFLAVHGAPSQINRWIFPSTPAAEKAAEISTAGVDGVIAGHSGIPFAETVGDGLWVNSGSIGMPANDGTPRGWYAILDEVDGGIAVTVHALDYDHSTAAARMRAVGLPEDYAVTLETGLWPSEDILPDRERSSGGQRLPERQRTFWPVD